jgi:O-antigen/teichoic acid export membrane protein
MSSPSFLRRAGPLVLARFASAVVTTVVPLVLARAMAIEEYGTYKQLFLVGVTLTSILAFGIPQSLYYFLPRTEQGRPYIVHVLVLLAGSASSSLPRASPSTGSRSPPTRASSSPRLRWRRSSPARAGPAWRR